MTPQNISEKIGPVPLILTLCLTLQIIHFRRKGPSIAIIFTQRLNENKKN